MIIYFWICGIRRHTLILNSYSLKMFLSQVSNWYLLWHNYAIYHFLIGIQMCKYVPTSGFFFTIGKKTETKKLRILKKLRVIPAKKLRLSEALCNVPGPKNWDYRRPYLVSSAQKNSEYEKNSKLSTKNSACRRVGPTRSSKNLVKKKPDIMTAGRLFLDKI